MSAAPSSSDRTSKRGARKRTRSARRDNPAIVTGNKRQRTPNGRVKRNRRHKMPRVVDMHRAATGLVD
jgi:hypothetical protein